MSRTSIQSSNPSRFNLFKEIDRPTTQKNSQIRAIDLQIKQNIENNSMRKP
jgi:hypothetical protein